jgi:GNAT superfamily N-acetyltransferase
MIQYRPTSAADFEGVLALLRQLWPDKPIDPAILRPIFERIIEVRRYFCAEEEGRIVGFGGVSFRDNMWQEGCIAFVEELVVDSSFRGRGIGGEIIKRLQELARAKGCKRLELDSGFHRTQAHLFYEHLGFEKRAFLFSKRV